MTTLKTLTPYAIPVALLMMSVAFAAPAAHAERPGYKSFEVRISYDPTDSAKEIYSDVSRAAQKACHRRAGIQSIRFESHARKCKAEVVGKAVAAIGRTDLSALHYGERMTVIASK